MKAVPAPSQVKFSEFPLEKEAVQVSPAVISQTCPKFSSFPTEITTQVTNPPFLGLCAHPSGGSCSR